MPTRFKRQAEHHMGNLCIDLYRSFPKHSAMRQYLHSHSTKRLGIPFFKMTAQILDGRILATEIKLDIKAEIEIHLKQKRRAPGLAVILIGEDRASSLYVRHKRNACAEVGILSRAYNLDSNTAQSAVLELIEELNLDSDIDGILVQLPLPEHIDTNCIIDSIHPNKDVDGFHPYNLGRLAQNRPALRPCTPSGIMLMLKATGIDLRGSRSTVIGVSNIVGRPMLLELLAADSTVTACQRFTRDLKKQVEEADILIVAAGHPHLIKGAWIKPQAVVIDVGMNHLPNGQLIGDVEFEQAKMRASFITPVPGGVGPMTVACLLQNTMIAYEQG